MSNVLKLVQQDAFDGNYELHLDDEELHSVRRVIEGGQWGGNQLLAARFQKREQQGTLLVTAQELASAYTKAWAYGDGTWQKYFRMICQAAGRVGWEPSPKLRADVSARREEVLRRRQK